MGLEVFLYKWALDIATLTGALVVLGYGRVLAPVSRRTRTPRTTPVTRWVVAIASLLAIASTVVYRQVGVYGVLGPWPLTFAVPLLGGLLGMVLIGVLAARYRPLPPTAFPAVDLRARRVTTFGAQWWFVGGAIVVIALLITVFAAGALSSTDEEGRFTLLTLTVGGASFSTSFLGWFFGVPVLLCAAVLVALQLVALRIIASPPVPLDVIDQDADRTRRRGLVAATMQIGSGSTLFALGSMWIFLARSAQLKGMTQSNLGVIEVGVQYAPLTPALLAMGIAACGVGTGLLLFPVFRAALDAWTSRASAPASPRPEGQRVLDGGH